MGAPEVENDIGLRTFYGYTRIVILILTMAVLTTVVSNNIILNFTVICMDDIVPVDYDNSTGEHWIRVPSKVNALFSSSAIGSIIGSLVMVPLFHFIGTKKTLVLYGILSGITTTVLPFAAESSYILTLLLRVFQGFAITIVFTAIGSIANSWSPLSQIGTYISVASICFQLAPISAMPLSALACESSYTWRVIYYGQGVATLILWILFLAFYKEDAGMHRSVSSAEALSIKEGKAVVATKRVATPMVIMSKDKCVLAIWLSCIGFNAGFGTFLYFGPQYMHNVHGFDIATTGVLTSLPYFLCAIVKFIAGPLSDCATCVSENMRLKFFASFSQGLNAVFIILLSYATSPRLCQILYTGAVLSSGFNTVGVVKCIQLVARQHSHFVMSVMTFISNLCVFTLPIVVSVIVKNQTAEEWALLFKIVAGVVIVTNIPFLFYCRSEPAYWTAEDFGKKKSVVTIAA